MDSASSLISIDNAPEFLSIAQRFLGNDKRLTLLTSDAGDWIENNKQQRFNFNQTSLGNRHYNCLQKITGMNLRALRH
jgi:hypothetical protein